MKRKQTNNTRGDSEVVYHAGFPNPSEESSITGLSLDALVIVHPASTYFWQLSLDVATALGKKAGTRLVVDRALMPKKGDMVVAIVDEAFVVRYFDEKALRKPSGEPELAENVAVWGVVTYALEPQR